VRIRVILTGPPRVLLGRPAVDLVLPDGPCTLAGLLDALAGAEPRIAHYLRHTDGVPAGPFRPLLQNAPLDPANRIPDGATVTLLYAVAGG
jgi:hypothetical protein